MCGVIKAMKGKSLLRLVISVTSGSMTIMTQLNRTCARKSSGVYRPKIQPQLAIETSKGINTRNYKNKTENPSTHRLSGSQKTWEIIHPSWYARYSPRSISGTRSSHTWLLRIFPRFVRLLQGSGKKLHQQSSEPSG